MIGRDAFQETDIIGITQPITKHSVLVEDVDGARGRGARGVRDGAWRAGRGRCCWMFRRTCRTQKAEWTGSGPAGRRADGTSRDRRAASAVRASPPPSTRPPG